MLVIMKPSDIAATITSILNITQDLINLLNDTGRVNDTGLYQIHSCLIQQRRQTASWVNYLYANDDRVLQAKFKLEDVEHVRELLAELKNLSTRAEMKFVPSVPASGEGPTMSVFKARMKLMFGGYGIFEKLRRTLSEINRTLWKIAPASPEFQSSKANADVAHAT